MRTTASVAMPERMPTDAHQLAAPNMHGSLLARNSVFNLLAQGAPLAVGLVSIPFMVAHLGPARFGLLSVVWIVYGNMTFFELGLGRATTKFVAQYLAERDTDNTVAAITTGVLLQVTFGVVTAALGAACVPWLVRHVLHVPGDLIAESEKTLYVLAAMLPLSLPTLSLRGVLEAMQRFDLVNLVKGPQNVAIFVFPVLALMLGGRLPLVALFLASAWVLATLSYVLILLRVMPHLRRVPRISGRHVRALLSFGSWVTVSSVVGPFLTYLDRFYIGALLSLEAVAYYTAPSDAVMRLSVLPMAVSSTLFPAFSALSASGAHGNRSSIYRSSVKFLFAILGFIVLLLVVFARQLLGWWLGPVFAARSTLPLQILAIAVLINSLAWIPYNMVQGIGRPDITAKFHLAELAVYVVLAYVMTARFGLAGAALAALLRVSVDAFLLFWQVARMRVGTLSRAEILSLSGLMVVVFACLPLSHFQNYHLVTFALLVAAFLCITWGLLFTASERRWVLRLGGVFPARFLQPQNTH